MKKREQNNKIHMKIKVLRTVIPTLTVVLFLNGCGIVPVSGRRQLSLVPEEQIIAQSSLQYGQFVAQMPKSTDKKATDRVKRVCNNIAEATDRYLRAHNATELASKMKWEVNLIADRRINAFCMPGGKIVVFTGILPLCKTDAELATVISHEVSHAVARHSSERLSHEILRQMGGQAIGIVVSGESGIMQTVINQAYGLGSQLAVSLPYSRKHEEEADIIGLTFMALAGYNPADAITFWEKMSKASEGNRTPEFLSTHPSEQNRIKAIRKALPEAEALYREEINKRK